MRSCPLLFLHFLQHKTLLKAAGLGQVARADWRWTKPLLVSNAALAEALAGYK